ncbi:HAD-IIA family hydrolase [Criibacterium bergeronii]|uniref:Acid sugar phosphatase n=1 Tax=Criibacterium bergeronii TaxID=1871336 RepID=A0A552VB61_9FIRM|nr:HAD-IIA family hydrolase [Criibacterium bergeronii]TRW27717.1 HAD-IIA family hydrolase [Criibacterium bergeronii]
MNDLDDIKVFLLDMDGTIYLGNTLIDGAKEFLEKIKKTGRSYIFLTNNTSKDKNLYVEKLNKLGISSEKSEIYSSSDATIAYLNDKNIRKVFLVGNTSLENEFKNSGIEVVKEYGKEIDAVVSSFDTELTYEKLQIACDYIMDGILYISTHPDLVCPLEGGRVMPDSGAISNLIYSVTKKQPLVIGKPEKTMIEGVQKKYGFDKDSLLMVGDRLYTDVAMGEKAGIKSALVLSGETTLEDYEKSEIKATFVYNSVKDMINLIN